MDGQVASEVADRIGVVVAVRGSVVDVRFLTQPFFTTEQFTGLTGKLASLKDALDGCERILADEFKDLPESALYMIGAVDEAKAKVKSKPAAGEPQSANEEAHAVDDA